ncbi:MAG: hypothetical protein A2X94_14135 [Bdellovibrionales bacterium GWB1_55_8]|nr:MAG: hypothetical protein A2X94_14135 [Bdellovibrionales bacterium GWB1_55_8]
MNHAARTRTAPQVALFAALAVSVSACGRSISVGNLLGQDPDPIPSSSPTPPASPLPDPVSVVNATALFSDTFDAHADWTPPQSSSGTTVSCSQGQACATPIPMGYYDYRVAAAEGCSNLDGSHHTLNINSLHPRGAAGKSFVMWNEPCYSSGGSWGSDGLLGVAFPPQNEVYVRFWIQFPSDWNWSTTSSPMQKFVHLSHYDVTNPASVWDFFSGNQNKPRYVGGLAKYGSGTYRTQLYMMPSPLTIARDNSASYTTNDYLGAPPLDWTNTNAPGDGNWHSFEWYTKLNTAGGVGDGQAKFWYDGNLIHNESAVTWIPSGDLPSDFKWNHVWLGGNNSNLYSPVNEQRYAVDDFVVSAHYSGPPPKPLKPVAQSSTAGKAQLTWTAGDNGAQYLLSAYRIYYGTSADALNQSVTISDSATNYELSGLTSGQTYYFQVTAVNRASYDSNESESLKSAVVSVVVN